MRQKNFMNRKLYVNLNIKGFLYTFMSRNYFTVKKATKKYRNYLFSRHLFLEVYEVFSSILFVGQFFKDSFIYFDFPIIHVF